jgi:hypothetical protein
MDRRGDFVVLATSLLGKVGKRVGILVVCGGK